MNEIVERRVFGAIEFVDDLTDARVLDPLRVSAPGVRLSRNQSGFYVIREVDGHDAYTRAFDNPPASPARTNFTMSVDDPRQRYLPQSVTLALPRLLRTPESAVDDADNALKSLRVRLRPAAALPMRGTWAVLRLSVVVKDSRPKLGCANVLVEATPQPAGLGVRRTLTDHNGEALVVIVSAPPILPGPAGLTHEFTVALDLVFDKTVVRTSDARTFPLPDPDAIVRRREATHEDVKVIPAAAQVLSAGISRRHEEIVTWP